MGTFAALQLAKKLVVRTKRDEEEILTAIGLS